MPRQRPLQVHRRTRRLAQSPRRDHRPPKPRTGRRRLLGLSYLSLGSRSRTGTTQDGRLHLLQARQRDLNLAVGAETGGVQEGVCDQPRSHHGDLEGQERFAGQQDVPLRKAGLEREGVEGGGDGALLSRGDMSSCLSFPLFVRDRQTDSNRVVIFNVCKYISNRKAFMRPSDESKRTVLLD